MTEGWERRDFFSSYFAEKLRGFAVMYRVRERAKFRGRRFIEQSMVGYNNNIITQQQEMHNSIKRFIWKRYWRCFAVWIFSLNGISMHL